MSEDLEQLEVAAEQTIAAATAAVLWAGEDSQGVLRHVAGLVAARMAADRHAYTSIIECGRTAAPTHAGAEEFAEGFRLTHAASPFLEPSVLPEGAAPQWFERVEAALNEALADQRADTYSDDRGRSVPHPDPAVRVRAVHGSVRVYALLLCKLWGCDPLPLRDIEHLAYVVSYTALPHGF
ncbi:hypothetical protein BST28_22120 [Mycolicibacter kumamotonensis]|uniref:Uncharacterized protein n=1 Tax=Mycolicibacter kumamotonensis TaxID=354243 RepID=A0A1X0DSC2_9MYCO|nr:hypothetical protein [Mycolicibacter kumamotonensis]ORA75237.1 hypothetical protein BST28_22120 [Mycolicibacter kumamotonensis]